MTELTDDEFDARLGAVITQQAIAIEDVGWSSVGVFPTEDSPPEKRYQFTYTVGRSMQGMPELIVTGIEVNSAHAVIASLLDLWDVVAPQPGVVFEPHGPDGGKVVFAPVPDEAFDEHLTFARWHQGSEPHDFTALQVLWTDDEDRWPWDEGHLSQCDPDMKTAMPIFAGYDWRPSNP